MNPDLHMALVAFAAMMTPGPNNVLVVNAAATGDGAATFGVIASVVAGSIGMLAIAQAGLGALLSTCPALHLALKLISSFVLLALGIAMMLTGSKASQLQRATPIGPLGVLGLQFVNPKGWALMLAVAAFDVPPPRAFLIVGVVSFACLAAWAIIGMALRQLMLKSRQRRIFAFAMGGVLAISAPLMLV